MQLDSNLIKTDGASERCQQQTVNGSHRFYSAQAFLQEHTSTALARPEETRRSTALFLCSYSVSLPDSGRQRWVIYDAVDMTAVVDTIPDAPRLHYKIYHPSITC